MTSQLTGTKILFQDDFSTNGPLNSANWDYNHWSAKNNPSFLGLTQMRQSLPLAENGMARIRLDTWLSDAGGSGKAFSGSEAITNQAWDVTSGGIAFEGRFRFEGTQGGMIAGFFSYEDFPPNVDRNIHDEIDFEILTTNLEKISTNVFAHEPGDKTAHPRSIAMTGSFEDWHTYRMEWLPGMVRWFVDGTLIRTETKHVPTQPQQLHMNLWGVPTNWGPSPGDPDGPPVGDPSFKPATSAGANQTFFFDVDSVKVERLSTQLGNSAPDTMFGTANNDGIEGGGGSDTLYGAGGHDTLIGDGGSDTIYGGNGDDTVYAGRGNDIVVGGKGKDALYGGSDKDVLKGGRGGDLLKGGKGGDSLYGGSGDDDLRGGAGADLLNGNRGSNHLTGGKGADAFLFATKPGPANVGTITDFGRGNDHIALALSAFSGIGPKGELAADLFATSFFDTGIHLLDPDALIIYNPQSGDIFYDENGNDLGGLVLFARVRPGTHLDHSDFLVM